MDNQYKLEFTWTMIWAYFEQIKIISCLQFIFADSIFLQVISIP